MKRTRFGYRKLMALAAVLAISLSPTAFVGAGTVENRRADDPDLNNEVRILEKYFDDLVSLMSECAELEKKAVLQHIHINPIVRKSDDLTNRLPGVQQATRDVVRKLKVANLWDDLDKLVRARVANPIVHTEPWARTLLQEESFKRLLEDAAANLSSHKNEISIPVDNLRKRVASRTPSPDAGALTIALAAYHPPTPGRSNSLSCTVGKVLALAKVAEHLGRITNSATLNRVSCACDQRIACQ